MFPEGTEGTHITGAVVNQSVSDHLVLAFEAFASFASRTAFDRTIVRTTRAVHVRMGAVNIIRKLRQVRKDDIVLT